MSIETIMNAATDSEMSGGLGKAERLYLDAENMGSGHAAHQLGVLYNVGGPGVSKDTESTQYWLNIYLESGFEKTIATDPEWFKN